MKTHAHTQPTKTAIGYVRVSTQEQVTEGVSLDAQRDRIRAYCKLHAIKLIDIKADEGISGGTLNRPGLQAALEMIRRGRGNTLIVAKLDRLSRSLKDVCTLVEELFGDERYHLLSLCGMVNTHSAAGRMVLMNLANYAQFEREMISGRTRDALRHMMAQGVRLGPAPYGYELSMQLDEKGRRMLVPLASEQAIIARLASEQASGVGFNDIARQLNAEGIRANAGDVILAARDELRRRMRERRIDDSPAVLLVDDFGVMCIGRDRGDQTVRAVEEISIKGRAVGVRVRFDGAEGFVDDEDALFGEAAKKLDLEKLAGGATPQRGDVVMVP